MKLLISIFFALAAVLIAYDNLASRYILKQTQNILKTPTLHRKSSTLTTRTSTRSAASNHTNMTTPREIRTTIFAREQPEGAGATVRRSIGTPSLKNLTPFLMLDQATVSPGAGFPDHPHRGQETITYILKGAVDHEDFAGNKGTIEEGDLQFMTAGRGIMHSEMPNTNHAENVGLQLWVDLPQALKNCEPRYRDLRASEIPLATTPDGKVSIKVISGKSQGVDSVQDLAYTPVWWLDITIRPGGSLTQDLPHGWNAFAYILKGVVTFAEGTKSEKAMTPYHNVVFEQEGDVVTASVEEGASEEARFVLIAGQPLDQPIVQYGPFVATSRDGVQKALMDFQTSSNGFERANGWVSEIGKRMGRVY